MQRTPVVSSHIKSIGYDPTRFLLEIEFLGDGHPVYQYFGVPQHAYNGLMNAPSIGAYFARQILNRFPVRPVTDSTEPAPSTAGHAGTAPTGGPPIGW